jgi:hypothetical protein
VRASASATNSVARPGRAATALVGRPATAPIQADSGRPTDVPRVQAWVIIASLSR